MIVVVLLTIQVDEDFAPIIGNINGDGFVYKLVLDFHSYGSFQRFEVIKG